MNRLNHIKIISPAPEIVDAFLREVCDIPDGWPLGEGPPGNRLEPGAKLGPGGLLPSEVVEGQIGSRSAGGYVTGNPDSRQFQILGGEEPKFWAACISTRDIDSVYGRCRDRGVPVTEIALKDWTARDNIRFFFCVVGGLMFEVIRVEPKEAG